MSKQEFQGNRSIYKSANFILVQVCSYMESLRVLSKERNPGTLYQNMGSEERDPREIHNGSRCSNSPRRCPIIGVCVCAKINQSPNEIFNSPICSRIRSIDSMSFSSSRHSRIRRVSTSSRGISNPVGHSFQHSYKTPHSQTRQPDRDRGRRCLCGQSIDVDIVDSESKTRCYCSCKWDYEDGQTHL
jgi:hypothetical protein